mmetsp:Transcript_14686/g.48797  ORF Transcript_14686/g.48797 Transcript_14686/m.48797 type:complete len:220 (-) Transcript_14686:41-700(-)
MRARLGYRHRLSSSGAPVALLAILGWLGRGRLDPPTVSPRQTPGAREQCGCQRHIDTPPPAVLGLAAHAADHVAEAHLAVLHGRVERHGQRVEELVRRLLQHLRRLLKKLPKRATAAGRVLLGDWSDGHATVHCRLHDARDGAGRVKKGLLVQVKQQYGAPLERCGIGSLECVIRLADRECLSIGRSRASPLPRNRLDLPCHVEGTLVVATHKDSDWAA